MDTHDRILTVMILFPVGTPISDPTLTPLEIAQALLAGLIGHASLFFQAGILHRDLLRTISFLLSDRFRPPYQSF